MSAGAAVLKKAPEVRAWFDDRAGWVQVPWLYRIYAAYCRVAMDRNSGMIRGGSFLLRVCSRLQQRLGRVHAGVFRMDGRTVHVDLHDPRMLSVLEEVRGLNAEAAILRACLRAGDTFIDIGANHGSYALIAAALVGASGRIVAFEPQPGLARLLRASLRASAVCPWDVHEVAVGAEEGQADLYVPAANSGAASVHRGYSTGALRSVTAVPVRRVDDVLSDVPLRGRVFVKLDVEGSELAALRGCETLLRAHQPAILLELNPRSAMAAGDSLSAILTLLHGHGYQCIMDVDAPAAVEDLLTADLTRQRNVVVLPPGMDLQRA